LQKRFIYEKARSLGAKAILVDSPNHWGRDCVGTAFDAFYPVDLSKDSDTVLRSIKGVYNKVVAVSLAVLCCAAIVTLVAAPACLLGMCSLP